MRGTTTTDPVVEERRQRYFLQVDYRLIRKAEHGPGQTSPASKPERVDVRDNNRS